MHAETCTEGGEHEAELRDPRLGDRVLAFRHDWQPGEGTVVDVRYSGQHGTNQVTAEPHFLMDVRPNSGEPFRTEVDELPLMFSFRAPAIGAVVKLECDPARKKARFIRSDPAISTKGDAQAAKQEYEAELRAGAGATAPDDRPPDMTRERTARSGPASGPDPVEQLSKLADLRDRGVLTDAEFESQKAKILAGS